MEELTRSAVHAIASDDDVPLSQQQRRDEVGVLARTLQAFYDALNGYTLADLVRDPTAAAIIRLHRAA